MSPIVSATVYQRPALQRLNHFFRDFRTGDVTNMDPQLFDILYDLKLRLGDTDARFDIISAYRSPTTNARTQKDVQRCSQEKPASARPGDRRALARPLDPSSARCRRVARAWRRGLLPALRFRPSRHGRGPLLGRLSARPERNPGREGGRIESLDTGVSGTRQSPTPFAHSAPTTLDPLSPARGSSR
jgi:hypothetical protein